MWLSLSRQIKKQKHRPTLELSLEGMIASGICLSVKEKEATAVKA